MKHITLILAVGLLLTGCKTSTVTGGQSRHDTTVRESLSTTQPSTTVSGLKVRQDNDVVMVHYAAPGTDIYVTDTRQAIATSQPSVTVTGGQSQRSVDKFESVATTQPSISLTGDTTKVSTETAKEGELGGFHFETREVKNNPTAWGLIGLLVLAGGGFYLRRNFVGMIGCAAGIALAFLAPYLLVWAAVAAIAWLIFSNWSAIHQLVTGAQNAIDKLPEPHAETLKNELEKAQDPAMKRVVAAIKS